MITRRIAITSAIAFVFIFAIFRISDLLPGTSLRSISSILPENAKPKKALLTLFESSKTGTAANEDSSTFSPPQELENYFEQVFSLDKPAEYDFPALRQQCERTQWPEDDVYLQCNGMSAGLTSIMSQVKVCLKMAVETGTGLVLPAMPLRDSTNLLESNSLNGDAYMTYDQWFDVAHLVEQIGRACPRMKIIHPLQLDTPDVPVKNKWVIDLASAPGYRSPQSYFWTGRPFKAFFEDQYAKLEEMWMLSPERDDSKKGITVISIASSFLLFRITDDPTRGELELWNDLSLLIRFKEEPRQIVNHLLSRITRPFYGVHVRAENDTIWSSPNHQLTVDLDVLDLAWSKYGSPGTQKPLVYLACSDKSQVEEFAAAGFLRGWEVKHKWSLVQDDAKTLQMLDELAFDFQDAVDMGVMVRSWFFLGITGSAFSSTVANARDLTGRYRGSSFTVYDDGNARTHLFNDGDADAYACCL